MKETGMVRRIDELGRVVIPKEIRRTLRLKESDPLEIFTERDMLCFKKYSPVTSICDFADGVCASLAESTGRLTMIVDTDKVISARGQRFKDFVGRNIIKEVVDVLESRKAVAISSETRGDIKRIVDGDGTYFENIIIAPTVAAGDLVGGVIVCGDKAFGQEDLKLAVMCADILSRQF